MGRPKTSAKSKTEEFVGISFKVPKLVADEIEEYLTKPLPKVETKTKFFITAITSFIERTKKNRESIHAEIKKHYPDLY